jgi:tetratricopeptide (TPR) repeat protein
MNLVGRAQSLARAQRYAEAVTLLEPAHAAAPHDPLVAEMLALAYLGTRHWDDAAGVLETAFRGGVDSPGLRCAWATMARRRGTQTHVREQYEAALLLDRHYPDALLGLGRWHLDARDYPLAGRYLESAVQYGAGRDAAVYLAEVRTQLKDHGAAVTLLRAAWAAPRPVLPDYESDAIALRLADAEVADEQRRVQTAQSAGLPWWTTALGIGTLCLMLVSVPAAATTWGDLEHLARGETRLDLFDYQGCVGEMEAVLVHNGRSARAWAYEGVCYQLRRDGKNAQRALLQAYALNPDVRLDDPPDRPWDRTVKMLARAPR